MFAWFLSWKTILETSVCKGKGKETETEEEKKEHKFRSYDVLCVYLLVGKCDETTMTMSR